MNNIGDDEEKDKKKSVQIFFRDVRKEWVLNEQIHTFPPFPPTLAYIMWIMDRLNCISWAEPVNQNLLEDDCKFKWNTQLQRQ